jgi:hypothetical protein
MAAPRALEDKPVTEAELGLPQIHGAQSPHTEAGTDMDESAVISYNVS